MPRLDNTPAKTGWKRWIVPGTAAVVLVVLLGVFFALQPAGTPADADLAIADDAPMETVLIPGGTFTMGSETGAEDEKPTHEVSVKPFRLGKTEVTNGQFAAFVKATGYLTTAENKPDARKYPTADPALLVPGSAVYVPVDAPLRGPWETLNPPWWKFVPGANWRHPEGPGSSIQDRKDYPVVHIAWDDAVAFCMWAKKRLPTEAEWEFAARGGLIRQKHCWGVCKQGEDGKWYANTFQGRFPLEDTGADGFVGLAPVGKFPVNGYGLHDISGNVWEWCRDYYDSTYYGRSPKDNPNGPDVGEGDPFSAQPLRVRRGGSYMCDDNYCGRYVPSARDQNPADSGASHTGFRVASDE